MIGSRKQNKLINESTNVHIKLDITVSNVENSDSCNIVDSLLNEIWNITQEREGIKVENLITEERRVGKKC